MKTTKQIRYCYKSQPSDYKYGMGRFMQITKRLFMVLLLSVTFLGGVTAKANDNKIEVQNTFDYIGPAVQSLELNGREVFYIDEGSKTGIPVVVIWGGATSIRALRLVDYVKSLRDQLGIRVISVEQNGMGRSILDTNLGIDDYVDEVDAVLAHLGINYYSIYGLSFAPPLVAALAERHPNRVRSIHIGAGYSGPIPGVFDGVAWFCSLPLSSTGKAFEDLETTDRYYAFNPQAWWDIGPTVPENVPGFADSSFEEGLYNFLLNGQGDDTDLAIYAKDPSNPGDNLTHQIIVQCPGIAGMDLSAVTAPVFLYHGDADGTVNIAHDDALKTAFSNASSLIERVYPGEGHDASRVHFDQILTDIKFISGNKLVVCDRDKNVSYIANSGTANGILNSGGTLGICAWNR